jgi:hypothetical protein
MVFVFSLYKSLINNELQAKNKFGSKQIRYIFVYQLIKHKYICMAKSSNTVKEKSGKASIVLQQQLDMSVYKRLLKYSSDNGLGSVQAVVRLACASLLTNQGY